MHPGSVIVDLAAETGGNCELTVPGEIVERVGGTRVGLTNLATLVLAGFVGYAVISKVPNTLHTPLMSGTNAIHGIVLVGAILVAGRADADTLTRVVGFVAVLLATANVVGGFVVTDRMLEMFKRRPGEQEPD
jgi:NAD(P) transhydrogenase subunit alpha